MRRILGRTKGLDALLQKAHVEYHAPADARTTRLPPASVDLVYSNTVMEHVSEEMIRDLMRESAQILRPGGLALHNIACNDHYALIDRKMWNNSLQYQNRLRAPEFLELATHRDPARR